MSVGKRKRDDFASQYHNGYIPQQDGAGDAISDELKVEPFFCSVFLCMCMYLVKSLIFHINFLNLVA